MHGDRKMVRCYENLRTIAACRLSLGHVNKQCVACFKNMASYKSKLKALLTERNSISL
jgi:hypothetical protein